MLRVLASVLVALVALGPCGCGGDDTVDPTNPDASGAARPADAASEGSKAKDGGSTDAAKAGASESGTEEGRGDASDASHEAATAAEGGSDT